MISSERQEMRQIFFNAWKKYTEKLPLEALEAQLVEIIEQHPEYHLLLSQPTLYLDKDFDETNPILHLSLHLSVRDQVKTNRPAGIQTIFQTLCQRYADSHKAEHHLMECLAHFLWQAQQTNTMPSDEDYLEYLNR